MNKILLIVAMPIEAKPIIDTLMLKTKICDLDPDLPAKVYTGVINKTEVWLVHNTVCQRHKVPRIGTQAATWLACEAIRIFQPAFIINVGTCGGFQAKGAQVGDVYLSKSPIRYHGRVMTPAKPYIRYGIGNYSCHDLSHLAAKLNLKLGIVSTSDSLSTTVEQAQQLKINQADVVDMEAAAIADVAELKNIPFVALKAVTDLVDLPGGVFEQYQQHVQNVVGIMAAKLNTLLAELTASE